MNSLTITIIAIILSTLIAGFVKRNAKDKCIKDFKHNNITLLTTENEFITGRMIVESTGLEFVFNREQIADKTSGDSKQLNDAIQQAGSEAKDNTSSIQASPADTNEISTKKTCDKLYSYILYKTEFQKITALIRYHKNLSEKDKASRKDDIDRTYHPTRLRRIKRRFFNMMKMLKDSMMEIFTVLTGHISKQNVSEKITAAEINQTTKVQKELVNTIDAAYDPLLEKYIGNLVILQFNLNNNPIVLKGILKEYTSEFIELLDTLIKTEHDTAETEADIVVPRRIAVIRGVGEYSEKSRMNYRDKAIQEEVTQKR